jgi:alanine racemase
MEQNTKRTWAEVHLEQIAANMQAIRASLPAGTKFLGVVKADAYGHGAVPVSRCLQEHGADYLAVSCLDEALELRRADISLPILILGHTPAAYVPTLIAERLTQTVTNQAKALEYDTAAAQCGGTLIVHIKLDTGMSRLGFLCAGEQFEAGAEHIAAACACRHLAAEGIYTHFAVSDEPGPEAEAYTRAQFRLFTDMIDALGRRGIRFALRHCANSGAVLHYPETALDMVRPGILLYGYGGGEALGLKPCMDLLTRVSTIKSYEPGTRVSYGGTFTTQRRTRMGVIPIGYADGLFRCLSNRCAFSVGGGMAPQRGRICMDMCMIDLTELPDAEVDSLVEIFGAHAPLDVLAEAAGTISYELLCSVSKRVPRVYR